ncbi:DsbE family thiol:disulfide interchange protein [Altererythrobacter aquiaggeris]|uniref:DsbE family thiol:disulfide interchange protein n=1 Tax=Aestuarierythrobacter aquiaggeris TaxID=1898396 RepID=UPI00301783D7
MIRRWYLWLPLLGFLGFLVLVAAGLNRPADREVASRMIGKPLPEFSLKPAAPEMRGASRADFTDGKPKLLNVWASWCVPCIAEAPHLETLKQNGAQIIGIAIRDKPADVAAFLVRNGNPYSRIGADDLSELQLEIGSSGVPETFVVDGKGVITYQHIGDVRAEHVPVLLEQLAEAAQ